MEEGPMALMYALLEVADAATLAVATAENNPRAYQYNQLNDHQKQRVQEALYQAFYSILEGNRIDYAGGNARQATNAIGEALARLITEQRADRTPDQRANVAELKRIMQNFLYQAIDDWT
jgi:hypothetical protein